MDSPPHSISKKSVSSIDKQVQNQTKYQSDDQTTYQIQDQGQVIDKSFHNNIEQQRKIVLCGIILANLFRNTGGQINDFLLASSIPVRFGGDSGTYGLVYSIFSLAQFFFMIPLARWSDRFGRKRMMLFAFSMFTIGAFLCGFATNLLELYIFRFIQGSSAFAGVVLALINDYYPEGERGKPIAYFSASLAGGYLIGSAIAGWILGNLSYQETFLLISFLSLISLFVVFLCIKDNPGQATGMSYSKKREIELSNENTRASSWQLIKNDRSLKIAFLVGGLRQFTYQGVITYLFYITLNFLGIATSKAALLLFPVILTYILSLILIGNSEKVMLLLKVGAPILSGMMLLMMWELTNLSAIVFIILAIFSAALLGMLMPAVDNYVSFLVPSHLRGELLGIYKSFVFFCGLFGPIIIGSMGASLSIEAPFGLLSIIMLINSFIIYFMLPPVKSNSATKKNQ